MSYKGALHEPIVRNQGFWLIQCCTPEGQREGKKRSAWLCWGVRGVRLLSSLRSASHIARLPLSGPLFTFSWSLPGRHFWYRDQRWWVLNFWEGESCWRSWAGKCGCIVGLWGQLGDSVSMTFLSRIEMGKYSMASPVSPESILSWWKERTGLRDVGTR